MTLPTIRESLGLSQIELDRLAGQARGTINNIESGKSQNPGLAMCVAITEALRRAGAKGVTVEGLFLPARDAKEAVSR